MAPSPGSAKPANSSPNRLRGVLLVLGLVLAVGATPLFLSGQRARDRAARMVADIERVSREKLTDLPADSEVVRRFGALQSLSDCEWASVTHATRQAVFAQGRIPVEIYVDTTGLPGIEEMRLMPDELWLKQNPDARAVQRGGDTWIETPKGNAIRVLILLVAAHPEFRPKSR